jgi:hypothetical protein
MRLTRSFLGLTFIAASCGSASQADPVQTDQLQLVKAERERIVEWVSGTASGPGLTAKEEIYFAASFKPLYSVIKFSPEKLIQAGPSVAPALLRYVEDPKEWEEVRIAFLIILGRLGSEAFVQRVVRIAADEKSPRVRGEAIRTIGKIGGESGRSYLKSIASTNPIALLALAQGGDLEAEESYLAWLELAISRATRNAKRLIVGDHSPIVPPEQQGDGLLTEVEQVFDPCPVMTGTAELKNPKVIPILIEGLWLTSRSHNPSAYTRELLKQIIPQMPVSTPGAPTAIDSTHKRLMGWWQQNAGKVQFVRASHKFEVVN